MSSDLIKLYDKLSVSLSTCASFQHRKKKNVKNIRRNPCKQSSSNILSLKSLHDMAKSNHLHFNISGKGLVSA